MKVFGAPASSSADINCRQDAPVHRHQMRRERYDDLPPGGDRKLLIELGHVPMMANAIGVEARRNLGKEHGLFGGAPCSGHARLGIDHDLVDLDRLVLDEWDKR